MDRHERAARRVVDALQERNWTLGVSESLTGGLVCAQLTAMGGVSSVLRGGLIVYSSELKTQLLGVPSELIEEYGAPSEPVARAMAEGTRSVLRGDINIALTGVAGPGTQDGWPVGSVHIGLCQGKERAQVRAYTFDGGRESVRESASVAALDFVYSCLDSGE